MSIDERMEYVAIEDITIPKDRRIPHDAEREIDNLAESMAMIGLLNPITITTDMVLVAGYRRLKAWEKCGKKTIKACIRHYEGLEVELAEISENLIRGQLDQLERVALMARKKELYEALYPETKKGKAQAIASNKSQGREVVAADSAATTFTKQTAKETGRSERSIRDDVAIGNGLDDEAAQGIKGTPVANNREQLRNLSKLPKEEQKKVAAEIKADPTKKVPKPGREAGNDQLKREALSLMRKLMATLGQLGHTNECDDEIEAIMAFVKSR